MFTQPQLTALNQRNDVTDLLIAPMSVDLKSIRKQIDSELPRSSRWWFDDTPLDWEFAPDRYSFLPGDELEMVGGDTREEWSELLIFGSFDYAEGGGAAPWIAVRTSDQAICGIDVERKSGSVLLFNSTLRQFVSTFSTLDQYFSHRNPVPSSICSKVGAIDPLVYPISEWSKMIAHT
ncbi:MAG: hypothetical protein KDA93_03740 [Planctomycetaceae bacterium]|nr:hypothetical protein [Planctomycetaceae bacterium]